MGRAANVSRIMLCVLRASLVFLLRKGQLRHPSAHATNRCYYTGNAELQLVSISDLRSSIFDIRLSMSDCCTAKNDIRLSIHNVRAAIAVSIFDVRCALTTRALRFCALPKQTFEIVYDDHGPFR